jgi:hypothetical protein
MEGGYTDVFELICGQCGDHPYLNYSEVPPCLQWIRGPYMLGQALQRMGTTSGSELGAGGHRTRSEVPPAQGRN